MLSYSLKPGIYFDLPEENYHSDTSLSRSDLARLLESPRDYWDYSNFNPKRAYEPDTKEKITGKLAHLLLLQPNVFDKTYRVIGLESYSTNKPKAIDYIQFKGLHDMVTALKTDDTTERLFEGGYPEVTIVWESPRGYQFRVRLDYLHPFAALDYKCMRTITPSIIGYEFGKWALDVQQALYLWGVTEAKKRIRENDPSFLISGEVEEGFIKSFADFDEMDFRFVCQRKSPPYIFERYTLDQDLVRNALSKIDRAEEIFDQSIKKWGLNEWGFTSGKLHTLTPYQFSKGDLEKGINLIEE